MAKTIEELAKEVAALRTLVGQQHTRITYLETNRPTPSAPTKKRKKTGTNTYMYWCNNMGMREKIRSEHASRNDGSVDMKEVVSDLGKRWKMLPQDAKDKVKQLCDDHNKLLRNAEETCA